MSHAVEFGAKADADAAREEYEEYVCPVDDDKRTKTVHFVSDIPEPVLDSIRAEAEEGRSAAKQGTALAPPLSEGLRERISDMGGFDKPTQSTFNWRKAKAIYAEEGFPSKFGDDLGVLADHDDPAEGARETIERRKRGITGIEGGRTGDGGGARNEGERDERQKRKQERAAKRQQAEECDHARDHCKHGDPDACEFLTEVCGFDHEEIEEIMAAEEAEDADDQDLVTVGEGADAMEVTPETAGALKRSWGGYQGALSDVRGAVDTLRESWANAQGAARAINDIRGEHGEEPLHFDALEDVQGDLADLVAEMARDCEECHLGDRHQATLGDIDADAEDGLDVDRLAGLRDAPLPMGEDRVEHAARGDLDLDRRPPGNLPRVDPHRTREKPRTVTVRENTALPAGAGVDLNGVQKNIARTLQRGLGEGRTGEVDMAVSKAANAIENGVLDIGDVRDPVLATNYIVGYGKRIDPEEFAEAVEAEFDRRADPDLDREPTLDTTLPGGSGRVEQARQSARERRELRDPWTAAVEAIRADYGDSYSDRVQFPADVRRALDRDLPRSLADEGVTQPILRYQDVPPEDALRQIERRAGEADARRIRNALLEYAGTLDANARGQVLETDDQRTLGGSRADDQARLAGGERGETETTVEQPTERNPGGLAADQRETGVDTDDLETARPDAFQVAEGGQETLGDTDD